MFNFHKKLYEKKYFRIAYFEITEDAVVKHRETINLLYLKFLYIFDCLGRKPKKYRNESNYFAYLIPNTDEQKFINEIERIYNEKLIESEFSIEKEN